jgi:pyruvate/2-oxoglutarate dehydrogenase complex dihydrolipoamide dehydrogenase (E3) component
MLSFHHKKYDYDLIIIGSGAGGSVGAHYARTLGKKVALFEKGHIGGECPNFACVPTKALLHAAHLYDALKGAKEFGINITHTSIDYHAVKKWKDLVVSRTGTSHGEESFHKDGIHLIKEKAHFVSPHEIEAGGKIYSAAKFLIATGSKVFIPPITGIEDIGFLTFKEAINLTKLPASLLIFGAGPVGCELAQIFATFGTKVTLVNRSERILGKEDKEVTDLMQALFENQGITVLTNTSVIKIEKKGDKKIVHLQKKDKEYFQEIDDILIATGKVPDLNFTPEKAGIQVEKNHLKINRYLQTTAPHIYVAGDIVGPYLFTHTGYYQSYIAVHNAFSNKKIQPNYAIVPRCVFTTPEVASVGLTEIEAQEKGIRTKKGITAMAVLGRANTENEFDGFVKIVTDTKSTILGASIVAPRAGEMIHEIAVAMKFHAKAQDLADLIHAYPTFSEAIKIACSNLE